MAFIFVASLLSMSLSTPTPSVPPHRTRRLSRKTLILIAAGLLAISVMAVIGFTQNHKTSTPFCQTVTTPFAYTVCEFRPGEQQAQLQLAWRYPNSNNTLLNFANLKQSLPPQQTLHFAMNAGMYDERFAPIGYTVIQGQQIHSLNLKNGGGNFHMMPNGVFWWDKGGYHVTESHAMAKLLERGTKPLFATQSGPMLVINGKIHPSFSADSSSQKLRNGVGVCQDGRIKFVISDTWVSFYQFAALFKNDLGCDNALFLDGGRASALYSRELTRSDVKSMGAILALTTID